MNLIRKIKTFLKKTLMHIPLIKSAIKARDDQKKESVRSEMSAHGLETLEDALNALWNERIHAFVAFGTLLGIIRDGELIAHDLDVDTAFIFENKNEWPRIEKAMEDRGYEKVREFKLRGKITEQTYWGGGFTLDIFALFPESPEKCRAYLHLQHNGGQNQVNEWATSYMELPMPGGIQYKEAKGMKFPIPDVYPEYLCTAYGKNWKQPDPNYRHEDYWVRLEGECGVRTLFKR